MITLTIATIGKKGKSLPKGESWIDEGIQEYLKRLSPAFTVEWKLSKTDAQLIEAVRNFPHAIYLHPRGKLMKSETFSEWLFKEIEIKRSVLYFVIGGAEGIPQELLNDKRLKDRMISLSPLTFTHQMCRFLLLEQIYRGWQIAQGGPYHK